MDDSLHQALALLIAPGLVVEVRTLTDQWIHSGYFDDREELARQVAALDTDQSVQGIYVTLNEVNPALLSRRANRIKMRLGKKDATTCDADILRRRWFPIDIDPVRPSGVSSNDEEHQAALVRAAEIAAFLGREQGWPAPVMADSGNGAHLLYRIDLPNDEESRDLVKKCLDTLDTMFSNSAVTVDTANFNAARIWKIYGTTSRKGDNTRDRPHRKSLVLSGDHQLNVVDTSLLHKLAEVFPCAPPEIMANKKAIDLRGWLTSHGLHIAHEKPYLGGTLFVLEECPFSGVHQDGAFAIQFPNGAIHAGCHHASCGGGRQRWPELRAKFEPDRVSHRERHEQKENSWPRERARARAEQEGRVVPAASPAPPPEHRAKALEVLRHGDPLALMLAAFAQEHVGDEILARCMILSMASQAVKNSDGLHVSVTGDSGKGKTHAFRKMLRQVPDRLKVKGTVSNKALYYMKDLAPRSVLMSDDTELSDSIQEILKSATSNFNEPITHTTVTKDLSCRVCRIPERCVWWIAKKEGTGDDQVMNRMLTCWIDESPEQDARVLAAKQRKEQQDPDTITDETPELRTCRAIWEVLHEQVLWVIIPFSARIRFHAIRNRRNPDMFYDLIKSHTALFFMQRAQKTAEDGTLCVYATDADFSAANEIFTLLNGTAGGQESKLTKKEADLLAVIQQAGRSEFTTQDLQRLTGSSYSSIYRTIKGYDSRGKNYTGLLEKCPALSYTDRTVTMNEEDGISVRRRTEAYAWDPELYRYWASGGACWLDRDPKTGGDSPGPLQPLQQDSCSFPADAENDRDGFSGSGFQNDAHRKENSVLKNDDLQQSQEFTSGEESGQDHDHSVHDPKSAATENQSGAIRAQSGNQETQHSLYPSGGCTQPAATMQATPFPTANDERSRTIRVADYKPLDIPEPGTPCYLCGKKGSWFVEKLTAERKARPRDQQEARRICRLCHDAAVKAEQSAKQPLPGTVDISRCTRLTVDVGKCSICGLEKAVWVDPSDLGVHLCEHCYTREVRGRMAG